MRSRRAVCPARAPGLVTPEPRGRHRVGRGHGVAGTHLSHRSEWRLRLRCRVSMVPYDPEMKGRSSTTGGPFAMAPRYDLIVIGSGPAGEKGALQAAHCGRSVALIERSPYLGGTSINTGTIPSKSLREAALYFSGLRQRGLYGIDYSLKANLTVREFMFRAKAVMETERALIQRSLDQSGVAL